MDANAASVAIVKDGQVLLIKRAREPYAGLWTLPGGRCEPGESAPDAAVREVREELGLTVSELRPLTLLAFGRWRLEVFATESFEGTIAASDEVAEYQWSRSLKALATTPDLDRILRLIPALA